MFANFADVITLQPSKHVLALCTTSILRQASLTKVSRHPLWANEIFWSDFCWSTLSYWSHVFRTVCQLCFPLLHWSFGIFECFLIILAGYFVDCVASPHEQFLHLCKESAKRWILYLSTGTSSCAKGIICKTESEELIYHICLQLNKYTVKQIYLKLQCRKIDPENSKTKTKVLRL
jgi:hypothetical protein